MRESCRIGTEEHVLLLAAGAFDAAHYAGQTGLTDGPDLLAHYLDFGWRWGLEPRPDFEGAFLAPYYASAGWSGPPLLTFVELNVAAVDLPCTQQMAEQKASLVRASGLLDAESYAKSLPPGMDPFLHYVVIGGALGWRPSAAFDPVFYCQRYPDIVEAGVDPLLHFMNSGYREQRSSRAAAESLAFPSIPSTGRRVVLMLVHEASRTGAPLLGLNLVQHLSAWHDMVAVVLSPGALLPDFAAASSALVGPMRYEHWHSAEMEYLAERLARQYRPLYAVANSIETSMLIPALAMRGVPTIALVHEFAAYTKPASKLGDAFDWAADIVFPAQVVASSAAKFAPYVGRRRGVHVFPQGRVELPRQITDGPTKPAAAPPTAQTRFRFTVLGAGWVDVRKGVDVFLSVAAAVRRIAPELDIGFIWIGGGYDPQEQLYPAYLAEQVARAGVERSVRFIEPVADMDPVYAGSDVLLLSSRLDPQPNVGIDALTRGLPVVCFDGASGTAEVLQTDVDTRILVAPYLAAEAAARIIIRLAGDPALHGLLRAKVKQLADRVFDMQAYVARINAFGLEAASRLREQDFTTLRQAALLDAALLLPPEVTSSGADEMAWIVLQQWATVGLSLDQAGNRFFRRAFPGFNPQVYAVAHPEACVGALHNPLAHWLQTGQPDGPWTRRVLWPEAIASSGHGLRVALHGHFYYPALFPDLCGRLLEQATRCDLFITTDTAAKAEALRGYTAHWPGEVEVDIVPNRGRDIGPFLACLADLTQRGYHVVGHVHGKQSGSTDAGMGDRWRGFLWDNLVGPEPVLDTICATFAQLPDLGLVMAEDPHLVGWDGNHPAAEQLHRRMGLRAELPVYFDFPLGTMFWARPEALHALAALRLDWNDYPIEPLADDGTIVHAIERLLPMVVRDCGYAVASIRVPGTSW